MGRQPSGTAVRGLLVLVGVASIQLASIQLAQLGVDGFCPDPQATNYDPYALAIHAPDCTYNCLEIG